MLSPIMPTISLTIEDIPNLDIFANGANITNFNTDYCRPMFSTEGASLLVDELGQAGLEASLILRHVPRNPDAKTDCVRNRPRTLTGVEF
jgi:hypothetical protein